MSDDDPLIPVFIPALVVLLTHAERSKGSPLTREEVMTIRNKGVCVMMRGSLVVKHSEQRGYDDIDPEFAWEEWQEVRASFPENQGQV